MAQTRPTAALFPGQGSQTAGMRDLVQETDEALLEHCCDLVGDDPFPQVDESTRFAQPAIFCASVAAWSRLEGIERPAGFAGHSLGEFAALAAGGAIDRLQALELVVERGRLMAGAETGAAGGMLALLGSEADSAEIAATHALTIANDNAPGQLVVSGPAGAIDAAGAEARTRRLKAMRLGVTAAFHSDAMLEAAAQFRALLAGVDFRAPSAPVWSSMSAAPFEDPRRELAQALARGVRWRDVMMRLRAEGVRRVIDFGPGRVLARLVRRTLDDVEALEYEGLVGAPA
jgi:[acyl-carrier-protein] S-malonyltransferase